MPASGRVQPRTSRALNLSTRDMWKMPLILFMMALAIFFVHRALEGPVVETGLGAAMEIFDPALAPLAPPLMYADIRG
jgi:hypothetical protein